MSKICVTGANGQLASWIVKKLLERGHEVVGTVRDKEGKRCEHLRSFLPRDKLTLFNTNLHDSSSFDQALSGCSAVFHTASPLAPDSTGMSDEEAHNVFIKPACEGTENVIRAAGRAGIKQVVFTSSMAAINPIPEVKVKDESCWSDENDQIARKKWQGASKTIAEKKAIEVSKELGIELAVINPTLVIGPMFQSEINTSMKGFRNFLKMDKISNGSMSVVDVEDCALHHINCWEKKLTGRFMSLKESWHQEDLARAVFGFAGREAPKFEGEKEAPTQFDYTRMDMLGVKQKSMEEILKRAFDELKQKDLLE